MVTCADGNTQTIEEGAHIEVVDGADVEGNDGVLVSGGTADSRTVDVHTLNSLQLFHAVAGELLFVGLNGIQAYTIQEIDGGG